MKVTGLPINEERHLALIKGWESQREESEKKLKEELGDTNPNSSKQLNEWLKKNIDKKTLEKWRRTKTGAYQTSGDVLKHHKDKLPWWEAHRSFKKVDKRLNNYGQKMINLKSPVTKRIHSDIFIAGTDTGRLSSANPNCQNFPRDEEFRKIFEAPEGKKLIVADYSQVELRVAAIVANDWVMLKAYEKGEDLHRKTAAFVAGIKEEEVTKEERQKAKAVNFGFLFGMGAERFVDYARDSYGVKLTLEDSKRARSRFFDTYKGISIWHSRTRKEVERTYKSSTPMGFIRYFDKSTAVWKIQNEALNTPVQGGAAEVTLKALHHIGEALDWSKAQIINCIHDEIIIESNDDYVETASKILEKGMVQGFLDVFPKATTKKLVEVGNGKNWVEAK
jgi:DNA polymerase-1